MAEKKITVPNIGDFKEVEVIEVLVKKDQIIKKKYFQRNYNYGGAKNYSSKYR